jgi:hypothetical protein
MDEFTIEGFTVHLQKLIVGMPVFELGVLQRIGARVTTATKDKIGEYQTQSGPFAAWAPLAESTKEGRLRAGYSEDDPLLRSGELRDSYEYVVVPPEVVIGSPLDIALWQELGTDRMPARSSVGAAAFEQAPILVGEAGVALEAYLSGVKA